MDDDPPEEEERKKCCDIARTGWNLLQGLKGFGDEKITIFFDKTYNFINTSEWTNNKCFFNRHRNLG